MFMNRARGKRALLSLSTAVLFASYGNALAYESPVHVFSINDVMGGFDGSTFGTSGVIQETGSSIICGVGYTLPSGQRARWSTSRV